MYKHILVPTDGSPQSRKAIAGAVELAKAIGAKVTGLFAAPPATPIVYRNNLPAGFTTMAAHKQAIEESAAKYLAVVEQAAKKAGVACEVITITSDYPADTILATAKKKKCDLIVMATHGRRGISSVLLGSETQRVVTQAKIPVLVYP
ncbi:MAG: universal stress protein [Xanthobacteraceae bacterium]|nr:universal stress protein [Xanthobacteraceae bacterium]